MNARERTCRVCGCTDRNACRTDDGPCFWIDDRDDLCSACAPAADHIVSMTRDYRRRGPHGQVVAVTHVGTCRCGLVVRQPATVPPILAHEQMDAAIRAHWQAVVAEAAS